MLNLDGLNSIWNAWAKTDKVLRFGQYVFNETGIETDNSYEIKDPKAAYNNLSAYITFKGWK